MHVNDLNLHEAVIALRPDEASCDDFPTWTSDMDEFDGQKLYVHAIDETDEGIAVSLGERPYDHGTGWWFSPDWLHPVDHTGDAMERLQ